MTFTEIAIIKIEQALGIQNQLLSSNAWTAAFTTLIVFALLALIFHLFARGLIKLFTAKFPSELGNNLVQTVRKPILLSALVTGLALSLRHFETPPLLIPRVDSTMLTIMLIFWFLCVVRASRLILTAMSKQRDGKTSLISAQTLPLFQNLSFIVAFVYSLYLLFKAWGIDLTAWIASAGIVGVAIGFAAKDTLANLISGVFIVADAPYKLGDMVVLETHERGEITHIGLRSTRMFTTDHAEITIPNSVMGNSKVINESGGRHQKSRVRIPVGVAYGSDIDQVKKILMEVALCHREVCSTPQHRVRFRVFGTSSLDFELLCWINDPQSRGRIIDELNTQIYKTFQEHQIEIPYAKQDIYIRSVSSLPSTSNEHQNS